MEKIVVQRIIYTHAADLEESRHNAAFVLNHEEMFIHLNLFFVYNGYMEISRLCKFPKTYMVGWVREGKQNLLQSNWNISSSTNFIHSEMTYYTNFID